MSTRSTKVGNNYGNNFKLITTLAGMDEKNERAIWAMLLAVCKEHKAQYFYMAPKFPYSLPFNRQVSMLICNNGYVVKDDDDTFNTNTFVKKVTKRR